MSRLGALSASAMRAAKTSSYWIARLVNLGAAQPLADYVVIDSSGYIYGWTGSRLSKYDSTGVKQWEYTISVFTVGSSSAKMVMDSSNNIILAGNSGLTAGVVAKINSSGSVQWSKSYSGSAEFSTVTVDSSNNIYLGASSKVIALDSSGSVSWAKNISFTPVTMQYSGGNIFLADGSNYWKMDTSGAIVWQYQYTTGSKVIRSIKTGSSGNVYMTGTYYVSSTPYPWLLKFSDAGTSASISWQYYLSATGGATPENNIAVDSSNNVYWIASTGTSSMIAKLDSSASISWQNSINQTAYVNSGIALESSNTLYLGLRQLYKLPTNGTKTGTYAFSSPTTSITYSSSSYSLNATSITLTATSATTSNATITLGSPGVAATAGTFTVQKITL